MEADECVRAIYWIANGRRALSWTPVPATLLARPGINGRPPAINYSIEYQKMTLPSTADAIGGLRAPGAERRICLSRFCSEQPRCSSFSIKLYCLPLRRRRSRCVTCSCSIDAASRLWYASMTAFPCLPSKRPEESIRRKSPGPSRPTSSSDEQRSEGYTGTYSLLMHLLEKTNTEYTEIRCAHDAAIGRRPAWNGAE